MSLLPKNGASHLATTNVRFQHTFISPKHDPEHGKSGVETYPVPQLWFSHEVMGGFHGKSEVGNDCRFQKRRILDVGDMAVNRTFLGKLYLPTNKMLFQSLLWGKLYLLSKKMLCAIPFLNGRSTQTLCPPVSGPDHDFITLLYFSSPHLHRNKIKTHRGQCHRSTRSCKNTRQSVNVNQNGTGPGFPTRHLCTKLTQIDGS